MASIVGVGIEYMGRRFFKTTTSSLIHPEKRCVESLQRSIDSFKRLIDSFKRLIDPFKRLNDSFKRLIGRFQRLLDPFKKRLNDPFKRCSNRNAAVVGPAGVASPDKIVCTGREKT